MPTIFIIINVHIAINAHPTDLKIKFMIMFHYIYNN